MAFLFFFLFCGSGERWIYSAGKSTMTLLKHVTVFSSKPQTCSPAVIIMIYQIYDKTLDIMHLIHPKKLTLTMETPPIEDVSCTFRASIAPMSFSGYKFSWSQNSSGNLTSLSSESPPQNASENPKWSFCGMGTHVSFIFRYYDPYLGV